MILYNAKDSTNPPKRIIGQGREGGDPRSVKRARRRRKAITIKVGNRWTKDRSSRASCKKKTAHRNRRYSTNLAVVIKPFARKEGPILRRSSRNIHPMKCISLCCLIILVLFVIDELYAAAVSKGALGGGSRVVKGKFQVNLKGIITFNLL